MIVAEGVEGCKIYYTTDESEPTADSVPWDGIPQFQRIGPHGHLTGHTLLTDIDELKQCPAKRAAQLGYDEKGNFTAVALG